MSEPLCATCGHPRDNHPYRHPFVGPSKDDTIKELETKLAKAVEALQAFKAFDEMPTRYKRPDVFEVSVRRKLLSTLAEIEGTNAP